MADTGRKNKTTPLVALRRAHTGARVGAKGLKDGVEAFRLLVGHSSCGDPCGFRFLLASMETNLGFLEGCAIALRGLEEEERSLGRGGKKGVGKGAGSIKVEGGIQPILPKDARETRKTVAASRVPPGKKTANS